MMFLWPLFLIALVILLINRGGASSTCCGSASHAPVPPTPPAGEDPMAILRRRLARGEITPAEFDEIRRVIG